MANVPAKRIKVTGTFGSYGEDGATFIPKISSDGTLSWTNNKGLDNPAPTKIIGPKGDPGVPGDTKLPDATEADEGKTVKVENGKYVLTEPSASGSNIEIEERDSATETVIFEEQTLTGFEDGGLEISPAPFVLTEGETYRVVWDGVEHKCVCSMQDGIPVVADGVLDDTGMPVSGTFLIAFVVNESFGIDGAIVNAFDFSGGSFAPDSATEHTLAIYQKVTSDKVILEKKVYDGFAFSSSSNAYYKGDIGLFSLEEGKTYRVFWDGNEHICKAYRHVTNGYDNIYLGNEDVFINGGSEITEPFVAYYVIANNYGGLTSADGNTSASHEVGIWEVVLPEPKILQYENGKLVAVPVEESMVAKYLDKCINEVFGGAY